MKKIITIFLLFSLNASCQKVAIGVHKTTIIPFSYLIQRGTFAPSTTLSTGVNKYQNFKKGWLISYNMNEFQGSYVNAIAAANPISPSAFNITNVNVSAWLDSAVANNVDYIVFTLINEYGFKMWRSKTPYNMSQITLGNGRLSPFYQDYSVQLSADTGIVTKFVNGCRLRGIEPVAYINSVNDYNVFHGTIPNANVPEYRQQEWVNYMSRLMQEMIITFGFKYMWLDYATNGFPAGLLQNYYNAVKSADPTCQIIGNALGETNFSRFPYDIESTEEHAIYGGSTGYQTTSRTYLGTTYYIGQEITGTPYGDMSQYYFYDSLVNYLPTVNPFTGLAPWTNLLETAPSTFQTLINYSKTYQKPFLAAMLINRQGVLVPSNLTYLRNRDFVR